MPSKGEVGEDRGKSRTGRGGTCSPGAGSPAGSLRMEHQGPLLSTGLDKPFPIQSPSVWSDSELEAQPAHPSTFLSRFLYHWLGFGSRCSSVCEIIFHNILSKTSDPSNMQNLSAFYSRKPFFLDNVIALARQSCDGNGNQVWCNDIWWVVKRSLCLMWEIKRKGSGRQQFLGHLRACFWGGYASKAAGVHRW